MTKEQYDKIEDWFTARPSRLEILKFLNRWLARIVYFTYPLLLLVLAYHRDERLLRVIAVPAGAFLLVTVLRKRWNFPRPYEKLSITPLIAREKKGQSFPSRHVASVTVIAAACFYVWPPLGITMSLIALGIAVIRPLAGIHFPMDVIAGALFSLLIGGIGFWFIP